MQYFYFDLGNVLVHFDAMIACRNIGALVGRDEREIFECLYGSGLEVQYEYGRMSDEQFAEAFRTQMGVSCDTGELLRAMSAMFTPNVAILKVIHELRVRKIELGILSNTCAAHWNWLQSQQWDVASGWFRDAVLSFEIGSMKPEPDIYIEATRIAGVAPDQIFFTDDKPENIEGARRLGWQAELFVDTERLMERLFTNV